METEVKVRRERKKKRQSLVKKKNQRIGIIGIIQGGWAQSGGVSVLGESFAILKERRSAQLATRTLTPLRIINE